MYIGWHKINDYWYYFNPKVNYYEGMMLKGFQLIDNNWYYFNEDSKEIPVGAMFIGFANIGEDTYYFSNSGHMCTGYKTIGTNTYYLEEKEGKDYGKLVTEPTGTWKQKGENWYYINNKTGFPEIGWVYDAGTKHWYYTDEEGKMKTGWLEEDSNKYYLNINGTQEFPEGSLITGIYTIGEKEFVFNDSTTGVIGSLIINKWYEASNGEKLYIGLDGSIEKNTWVKNEEGKDVYVNGNGNIKINSIIITPDGDKV